MFTVTLQSMQVKEIMETFTFNVKILENYVSPVIKTHNYFKK